MNKVDLEFLPHHAYMLSRGTLRGNTREQILKIEGLKDEWTLLSPEIPVRLTFDWQKDPGCMVCDLSPTSWKEEYRKIGREKCIRTAVHDERERRMGLVLRHFLPTPLTIGDLRKEEVWDGIPDSAVWNYSLFGKGPLQKIIE